MFLIYYRGQALVAAVFAMVSLTVLSTTHAERIPAGNDLFETVPNGTFVDFSQNPIPPGFFGPSSDPFTGIVPLQGVPFAPPTLGMTDTIVQRLSDTNVTQHGGPVTIPIEIVALHLVSVQPITVTHNGGQNPELWDLHVLLPNNQQQQPGNMIIIQTSPDGGTFTSTLPVLPLFTFTRISDGAMRTLTPQLLFDASNVPWAYRAERDLLTSHHFCPSCDLDGRPVLSFSLLLENQASAGFLVFRPATAPP